MATSAFKSTTRRAPIGTSSPSTEDSPNSSSSRTQRRSRSLSRFSRQIPAEIETCVLPTPRKKFVNTVRGSDFPEISLDDLAIEFFSGKENSSEVDNESVSSRSSRKADTTSFQRRSRSVSRHPSGANSGYVNGASENVSAQRRGRSVSRRNDGTASNAGGTTRVVSNADSRRRRSVSVARHQISDSESDIDHSRSSAGQPKSRSINNRNNQVASFQRPTASSHRRLTRSMSQAPQLRSHDDYVSQSSALTDEDLRDASYGRKEIEKTIRAVYAQKKIDHPTGDDIDGNNGLYEVMRKELRSAVNEIMIELEQNKSDATTRKNYTTKLKQPDKRKQDLSIERTLEEQQGQNGYKIVREVLPEPKGNANAHRASYSRKRSNDRNRVSKRLNEEAEKYFEDFISNIEDTTDFSSFDGERSDTSSSLVGPTKPKDVNLPLPTQNGINSIPVEMEGVNLPWLKWDGNDGGPSTSLNTIHPPTTPKPKLWDPSQDLELIKENGNRSISSQGSWNPEHTTANSTNTRTNKLKETKNPRFDINKYLELEKSEELLYDSWREKCMIKSGGVLLCGVVAPLKSYLHF